VESEFWEREKRTWPHRDWSRFVCAAGIRWHVQQAGSGPTMLLVHGTAASSHTWRALMPTLARDYEVLALDLPGQGFSSPLPYSRNSISGISEAVAGLLRVLGVRPQYCIGHSAGAVILCRLALDGSVAPRVIVSVNGAFLPLAGAAGMLFSPIARVLASTSIVPRLIARRAGNPAYVARLIAGTGSRLDAAGIDLYARLVRHPQHVAAALAMMSHWHLGAFARDLPRLAIPLALLVGDNDRAVPASQAIAVRERVPHVEIYRLAGLGHLAHEEQPGLLAREIVRICRAR
jgi:magnesium chelatase accessory protein